MKDDEVDFYIAYAIDVKMVRVIGNILVPTQLHVSASIDRADDAVDEDVEFGLTKCRYWLENIVSKTIAFSKENTNAMAMFLDENHANRTGNLFMMCPDDPRDECIGTLIQAKMNALAAGSFTVAAINIESDNMKGLSFTLGGNHSIFLPSTMEEWMGGDDTWFDTPWWTRDDASTIDVYLTPGAEKGPHPAWAQSLDFLDKSRRKKVADDTVTIIRPDFQPTIIMGGKDDEDKD